MSGYTRALIRHRFDEYVRAFAHRSLTVAALKTLRLQWGSSYVNFCNLVPGEASAENCLIRQADTDVVPLSGPDATAVGLLSAETATLNIVDAHVLICARRAGLVVVTSEPKGIKRIGPELRLIAV